MKIHEYQARKIFRDHGLPVPPERVAESPQEAEVAARDLGGPVVVKAQVHVGGRGKAGGVKLASDPAAARDAAGAILGMDIKGLEVGKLLIAPAVDIEHEAYVGIIVDRGSQRPVLMVSAAGGVDIEEVARETPEKIHKAGIDPRYGLLNHQAMALGFALYDDLPRVRRIGEHFLVAGHAGVENDFPTSFTGRAGSLAFVPDAVFKREGSFHRMRSSDPVTRTS